MIVSEIDLHAPNDPDEYCGCTLFLHREKRRYWTVLEPCAGHLAHYGLKPEESLSIGITRNQAWDLLNDVWLPGVYDLAKNLADNRGDERREDE